MSSRNSSKRESPLSQWKYSIGRVFKLGGKRRPPISASSNAGTNPEVKPSVESSHFGNIRSGESSNPLREETIFGTHSRAEPLNFVHSSGGEGGHAASPSHPPFHYPPLNPPRHARMSVRSVVTTLSPSSDGDGQDQAQECYNGVMVTRFLLTYHPSPLQQATSATGSASERKGDQEGAPSEPPDRQSRAEQRTRAQSDANSRTATCEYRLKNSAQYLTSQSLPSNNRI
jgi:hypothetical protein